MSMLGIVFEILSQNIQFLYSVWVFCVLNYPLPLKRDDGSLRP